MEIIGTVREMQTRADGYRRSGTTIGIVPTMGSLHEGHVSLIRLARGASDIVVTTVFVNPTQFGPNEDFNRYPRDIKRDEAVAAQSGSDILFCPEVREMYPEGYRTYVITDELSGILEGSVRPGHFRGVTTVVLKLFNIVKPHVAVFGQKDAQQAAIIGRMIRDLDLDIRLIVGPIVREADGLALSSRNAYLNPDERKRATVLYRSLLEAESAVRNGERSAASLRRKMQEILETGRPDSIDYVAFLEPETLREAKRVEPPSVLVALAARFGRTRLIDNSIIAVSKESAL
ncbi:MAG TPA: pantoate--beta-alanine ligase [Bacteroidota bacterium]